MTNQIERAIEQARLITEELMFDYPEAIAALGVAGTRIGKLAATLTNEAAPAGEGCPSCGGLNTSCPDGCERDPVTGELTATLAPQTTPDVGASDTARLNFLAENSYDLRCFDVPTGGGDYDVGWRVVGHWQAEPHERTIAEVYQDDPRAAIDAALNPVTNEGEER